MKRQNGAALIVVLSLLTVSLMVGVSSIQSSQIDERLAGNYRAQADAQMRAEESASDFYGWVKSLDKSFCLLSGDEAVEKFDEDPSSSGHVVKFENGFFAVEGTSPDGLSKAYVLLDLNCGGGAINARAAYACVGEGCLMTLGASFPQGGISGMDHEMPDGNSCSDPGVVDDDPSHTLGAIVVNGFVTSQGGGNKDPLSNIEGMPEDSAYVVYDEDNPSRNVNSGYFSNDDYSEIISDHEYLLNDYAVNKVDRESDDVLYVGPNSGPDGDGQVELDGRFDGLVILDGGTLVMRGEDCIFGVVLARSGSILDPGGNAFVAGAVIGQDFTVDGNGRPNIYYSSKAVGAVSSSLGLSDELEVRWEDFVGDLGLLDG